MSANDNNGGTKISFEEDLKKRNDRIENQKQNIMQNMVNRYVPALYNDLLKHNSYYMKQ